MSSAVLMEIGEADVPLINFVMDESSVMLVEPTFLLIRRYIHDIFYTSIKQECLWLHWHWEERESNNTTGRGTEHDDIPDVHGVIIGKTSETFICTKAPANYG